jgi:hypothetical protein
VNGQDVTASVVDGSYTLENASGTIVAEAIFTEVPKFAITYAKNEGAGVQFEYAYVYRGDKLSLKPYAAPGYKFEKIFFNGEEMTYNEITGEYEVVVTAAGEVTIQTSGGPVSTPTDPGTSDVPPASSGCASLIVANSLVVSLGAIACGLLVSKKREK